MNSSRRAVNYRLLDDSYELFEAPVTVPLSEWSDYVASGANTLYGGAIVPGGTMDDGAVYSGHVRQNPFTAGYPYPYDGEMEGFTPTNISQPTQPFVADVQGTVGVSEVVNRTDLPNFPLFQMGLKNEIQIVGPNANGGKSGFIRVVFTSDDNDQYQSSFELPVHSRNESFAENRSTVYIRLYRSINKYVYMWSARVVYTDESQKTIAYKINLQSKRVKGPESDNNLDQQDFNGILDLRLANIQYQLD